MFDVRMQYCRLACLVVAALFLGSACASSTPPETPCATDGDCRPGEVCDAEEGECLRVEVVNNAGNNHAPENIDSNNSTSVNDQSTNDASTNNQSTNNASTNNQSTNNASTNNQSTNNNTNSTNNATCTPTCATNEICENGQCVSACDPTCQAPRTCVVDECLLPDCTAVGDPCEPSKPDQGAFVCLTEPDDSGKCYEKCDEPAAPSTCPSGEYCFSAGNLAACVPRECDQNADCFNGDGSCIEFTNDFALCVQEGAGQAGDACDPDANMPQCESGTMCRETPTGGVCSFLCDPWASQPQCPPSQRCAYMFTFRQGLCMTEVDSATLPFEQCSNPGAACDDATFCFAGSAVDVCYRFCRPGQGDCAGVLDPDGVPTVCDNYAFGGVRDLGVCQGECSPSWCSSTTASLQCKDQLCRAACTPGNEVQDCCGGSTNCNYTCNPQDNLCE